MTIKKYRNSLIFISLLSILTACGGTRGRLKHGNNRF